MVLQICLPRAQNSGVLCQQKGEWKGQEMIDHQRHLSGHQQESKEECEISKSLCSGSPSLYIFPHLPGERHPWQEAVSPKTVAPSRIPLIMSTFLAGAGSLQAMGEMQAGPEVESEKANMSHHPQV